MRWINIPIFVPHRGCPNDCAFCDQKAITGKVREATPEDVVRTVEEYLKTSRGATLEIAFFGGSFTAIDRRQQNALLGAAYKYVKRGDVDGIRLSTRPDCINKEILENLKNYGVTAIELGVQSMDDEVLRLCRRGHTSAQSREAARLVKEYGFSLGLQMMTGLPGDTEEKSKNTAHEFVRLSPDCVRIYPTLVIRGTELYRMYERGEYTPQTLERAVDLCRELYKIFNRAGIKVIRTGLQDSGPLRDSFIAGPYAPDFGEMVKSALLLEKIEDFIRANRPGALGIEANPGYVSAIVGHKRKNLRLISERYGIEVRVRPNKNIDKFIINGCIFTENTL